ncbi:hypothetical protein [Chryseobacterium sp. MEBOG07]|uniref:hypothetical protein n=1 Tax=Chryseobacterium sp. MEBOG07 TaxID=2879939 RepID=UPI001F3C029B|nr:hypothetical protein [Chryseobacterium sp. MEBOG07]UKB79587.1 hypothetical protein LF886_00855 [Chryseobacterium sp. MEBOG07]
MKTSFFTKILSPLCAAFVIAFCLLSCTRCSEPPKEPFSNSYKKKLISYREGRVLFDEYTRTNHEALTKYRNGEPDSRWYWFSLEDMEGYIKYVKENAKKQNLKNPGIRIYMGKYPLNHPKNRMAKPEYAGYQTIFLAPTAQKKKRDNAMSRSATSATSEENTDVPSIESMNMTNLAPPPKTLSGTMP